MSSNRRSFLRNVAIGSGVLAGAPLLTSAQPAGNEKMKEIRKAAERIPAMKFNMCGYAAPKLDKVRVGFVGIGDRGSGAVERMTYIEGVEITALCDVRQAAVDGGQKILAEAGLPKAKEYVNGDLGFKALCESGDVDLVYICTSWEWHVPVAVAAMEGGRYVGADW